MKLWVDDIRPAPENYSWCKSVNEVKLVIQCAEYITKTAEEQINFYQSIHAPINLRKLQMDWTYFKIDLIDLDHDAGNYANDGGDYIRILDWFEETGRNYPIRIHSMNPVGAENMRRIIQRNGWTEVK